MIHRCKICHKQIKNGTLEDGETYCFKCYYFKNNPVDIEVKAYINKPSKDKMIIL